MEVFQKIITALMGLLPDVSVPTWLDDAADATAVVFEFAQDMGVWFPVTLLIAVLGALLSTWGIGFGIKIVRMVASFATGGGGSAA